MRRERRHGQEERLAGCRRRLDEPLGLARVDVGLVVAVRVTPSVQLTGDHLLPAVHLAGLGRRTPPVEAGRLIRRSLAGGDLLVAVQVLADPAGAVAPLVQGDRGRRRVVERLDRALGRVIAQDFVVVRVLAGEVGGATGSRAGNRGERLGEARALAADPPASVAPRARMSLVDWSSVITTTTLRGATPPRASGLGAATSPSRHSEPASASAARHARTCFVDSATSLHRPYRLRREHTPAVEVSARPLTPAEKRGPEYRARTCAAAIVSARHERPVAQLRDHRRPEVRHHGAAFVSGAPPTDLHVAPEGAGLLRRREELGPGARVVPPALEAEAQGDPRRVLTELHRVPEVRRRARADGEPDPGREADLHGA